MGYCYTTGEKVNGKWSFLKVDGRSNICKVDNQPLPEGERCRDCVEFCKTYSEAVRAVKDWEKINGGI